MAEKGQTSSITSVTEEEMSADSESDTTESSYSNITSSMLSSTDTDDKLTPGLINISLSNNTDEANSKRRRMHQAEGEQAADNESQNTALHKQGLSETSVQNNNGKGISQDGSRQADIVIPGNKFPYGSNPLPLRYAGSKGETKRKGRSLNHPVVNHQTPLTGKHKSESFNDNGSVDDKTSRFSSEFSETSSVQMCNDRNNNNELEEEEIDGAGARCPDSKKQTFLPDFSSTKWYQASCFNRYWSHYRFVMEWYHLHVQAVKTLQAQMFGGWSYPQPCRPTDDPRQVNGRKAKRSRHSRRSRQKRRKQSASSSISTRDQDSLHKTVNNGSDDEDLEMEITTDMLEFFATSYKHKLERDKTGEEPISSAPTERPGVRRTEEMKELYGIGAPMIQGMETAMQMTFDRFLDRFQPSPWPNMPLKITFA